MAVTACKECAGKVSSKAKLCPHCGAKVTRKVGVIGWLFVLFVVLPIAWQFGKGMGDSTAGSSSIATAIPTSVPRASTPPAAEKERASVWSASEYSDAMTDKKTQTLRVRSANSVTFEFPYNVRGGSHLSLVFRKNESGLDAYIQIDKGQMLCGVTDCQFVIKVGDGEVQTWTGLKSTTHDSDLMFVRDARQLEEIVRRGTPIRIGVKFYKAGTQAFDFIVTDYPGFQ